jgi:hypothetical protein
MSVILSEESLKLVDTFLLAYPCAVDSVRTNRKLNFARIASYNAPCTVIGSMNPGLS